VLPIIWKSNPNANFYIVGNQPSNRVMELSNDRIKVTGWVDDVNEFYQKSKVFVAPMLISTGLQNKILEAMANQTTCLISESANLALKAKNSIEVITAQSENEFAEWAIKLLNNRDLRENIGKSGKEFVNNHYSWEAVGLQLEEILKPNYI
jgi:glycosyltransferase involved in cell wall biosynthesis